MSYYSDLSPYTYLPRTVPASVVARNVGWLSGLRRFPRGEVPAEFTEALGELCRDEPRARTRGVHRCRLCHRLGAGGPSPLSVDIGGRPVPLGTAEVRVAAAGSGEWLIAPDLVHHYVTRHGYRPPDVFAEAVLARRVAPAGH
jgi:hypothetical protein